MSRRPFALTTVGLSVTDETLVKSMLRIVDGKTSAGWVYTDDVDADLALCDPQSSLLTVVIKRAAESGRPRCVAWVRDRQSAQPLTQSIQSPLRAGSFIDLLDTASVDAAQARTAKPRAVVPAADPSTDADAGLAGALRRLQADADATGAWQIECAGHAVQVLLPERRYVLSAPLDPALATRLAAVARTLDAVRLDSAAESHARLDAAPPKLLDALLWALGLHAPADTYPAWLAEAPLRLRQWPDLGRLGASRPHVALSALMARQPHRATELVAATGLPLSQVLAFANACELCGLLERIHSAPTAGPSMTRRVSGLFRSMRNALGMGS